MIEFQGQRKVVFRRCKFFGNKYARRNGKRKIFHETEGSKLLRREEHGNTFAHEIELFIGVIGIPAKRGRSYKIRADEKISLYSRIV
ncbi:hypothetical protein [Petrimonas sp.]|uniref:hypothetical protein n=1 Tax=Petrimonas sp. TaxID=2023866 RepID=UPI003330ECBE